ncbi:MAG: hypothetical protein AAF762_08590, partial [Pseudomonadota bacterium]
IAPHAKLATARISTLLADDDANRLDLATTVFDTVYRQATSPARALLIAPPISEPAPGAFVIGQETGVDDAARVDAFLDRHGIDQTLAGEDLLAALRTDAIDRDDALCDTFILSLMLTSELIPVVIPAGNDGSDSLAHPAHPAAYHRIASLLMASPAAQIMAVRLIERALLGDMTPTRARILDILLNTGADTPVNVVEAGMLSSGEFTIVRDWIVRAAEQFSRMDLQADAFAGTGIIVVGAGTVDLDESIDPGTGAITLQPSEGTAMADVTLRPARYSQSGPGLCLLAPSNDEPLPKQTCAPSPTSRPRAVGTADAMGHAGFADDPRAAYSHGLQAVGFGGTSAASAQVAAMIGYLPEVTDGPAVREALILAAQGVSDASALTWGPERGYGQARFRGFVS